MAGVKNKLLSRKQPSGNEYELTEFEFNFLKDLNKALATSIYHKRLMSGLLTYIAKTRLGRPEPAAGMGLQFQVDLGGEDRTLTVTEVEE